ncbi:MAG: ABC transporter permease, partial [Betaproteobacteria bacterium]|nr:ABC transporter permease [Betaproteobacteria bacterium]
MLAYALKRTFLTLPIMIGVSIVCFALVHLAPGDPLVSVLPPDASQSIKEQMTKLYGFDRPYHEQFARWAARAVQGDLGTSIRTGRPVSTEIGKAVGNTLMLAALATAIGFLLGTLFGFVAGYFRDSWVDKVASAASVFGVSVPHYWLGMVLVIIFAAQLGWLPPTGAGPGGSDAWAWDWVHVKHLILPAVTMSVIPMGIIARTVRALVAEILSQEFIAGLRAKGLPESGVFRHVVKNAAPTALAVMGIQLGYLLGGSILIETVFAWPGTGLLLNDA